MEVAMYASLELLSLLIIPSFILLDLFYGVRRYERARLWRTRALVVTAGIVWFTIWLAGIWGRVLDGYTLMEGSHLGTVGGAIVGIVAYEFLHYWYHRAAHSWN